MSARRLLDRPGQVVAAQAGDALTIEAGEVLLADVALPLGRHRRELRQLGHVLHVGEAGLDLQAQRSSASSTSISLMSACAGSTDLMRGWVRSRLVRSRLRARSASSSASTVASTVSICGTAWTTSPGSSKRSYRSRWAKCISGNVSDSAE